MEKWFWPRKSERQGAVVVVVETIKKKTRNTRGEKIGVYAVMYMKSGLRKRREEQQPEGNERQQRTLRNMVFFFCCLCSDWSESLCERAVVLLDRTGGQKYLHTIGQRKAPPPPHILFPFPAMGAQQI